MADPKLKATRADVHYSSDDGYSSDAGFRGTKERPELGLLAALEELARLTALFGFEDEALEVFNGARERVAAWKASRATPPQPGDSGRGDGGGRPNVLVRRGQGPAPLAATEPETARPLGLASTGVLCAGSRSEGA